MAINRAEQRWPADGAHELHAYTSTFEVTVIGWCWAGYKASTSYVFDHKPTEGEIKDKAGDFSQIIDVRIVENRYSSRLVQEFESEESEEFFLNEY